MPITNFDEVQANRFHGPVTGDVTGNVTGNIISGAILGARSIEKADSYALSATEKLALHLDLKNTGSAKVFTLGLAPGQIAFVYNFGSETFKVKNVAGDTGTSLATTKLLLIVGSTTANTSTVVVLN